MKRDVKKCNIYFQFTKRFYSRNNNNNKITNNNGNRKVTSFPLNGLSHCSLRLHELSMKDFKKGILNN